MKKLLLTAAFLLVSASAYAQTNPNVNCDATATNCTVKKNGTFQVTADVYTDPLALKWRLYMDGTKLQEVTAVVNTAPLFTLTGGVGVLGNHVLFMEAVGNCPDATGNPVECSTASANNVTINVVNGNPKAPTGFKVVK